MQRICGLRRQVSFGGSIPHVSCKTDAILFRLTPQSPLAGVEAVGATLALLSFADGALSNEDNARVRQAGLRLLMSPVLLSRLTSAPFLTVSSLEYRLEHQVVCVSVAQLLLSTIDAVLTGGGGRAAGKQCGVQQSPRRADQLRIRRNPRCIVAGTSE